MASMWVCRKVDESELLFQELSPTGISDDCMEKGSGIVLKYLYGSSPTSAWPGRRIRRVVPPPN